MNKIVLKSSCFFCVCIFSISISANAQIVYTDIKDITYTCDKKCGKNCYYYDCSKTYALDLNNDGTADFNINAGREVHNYDGNDVYGETYCCFNPFSNWVSISPLNDNSVLVDNSVLIPTGSAVMAGSDISSVSAWSTGLRYLRSISRNCQFYLGPCGTTIQRGDWPNSTDRYLGLKIILNGQTYYGWARLSVIVDENKASFKIKDYAYESTPDVAIIAGNTGSPLVTRSSNENTKEEIAEPQRLKITPNPVLASTIISFSLEKPGKVSIRIYNMDGRLISTIADREFTPGNHQMEWNATNMSAGVYLLQMQTADSVQTKKLVIVK